MDKHFNNEKFKFCKIMMLKNPEIQTQIFNKNTINIRIGWETRKI